MRHIVKGLDIFLDFDSVRECFDGIFVLVHGREKTIWNRNGWPILGVYHCRMGGYSSRERRVGAGSQGCNLDEKSEREGLECVE